ncbi:hypothetical protein DFQ29_009135 [Apophysomyces sp. BC1021]|nr:hypothetical protein DFQ29_009135 [Apophysomyces sp. BC1021]
MDPKLAYLKQEYGGSFDAGDFYEHFNYNDKTAGESDLQNLVNTICSLKGKSNLKYWAASDFNTIKAGQYWATRPEGPVVLSQQIAHVQTMGVVLKEMETTKTVSKDLPLPSKRKLQAREEQRIVEKMTKKHTQNHSLEAPMPASEVASADNEEEAEAHKENKADQFGKKQKKKHYVEGEVDSSPAPNTNIQMAEPHRQSEAASSLVIRRAGKKCAASSSLGQDESDDDGLNDDWREWRTFLQQAELNAEATNRLSLEKFHVIQCGFKIKCYASLTPKLYQKLDNGSPQSNPLPHIADLIRNIFALQNDRSKILSEIWRYGSEGKFRDPKKTFVLAILDQFFRNVFSEKADCETIRKYESTFNHKIVWPCLEAVVQYFSETTTSATIEFDTGEVALQSMSSRDEFTRYIADGIVLINDFEIVVLETSGAYGNDKRSRHGFDHIKGAFGAMAMFHAVAKRYYGAKVETLCNLEVFFVHARGMSLHVWAVSMPSENIYTMKQISKADIPSKIDDATQVLELARALNTLKDHLDRSCEVLGKMKEEHQNYMIDKNFGISSRERLTTIIHSQIIEPKLN